jgi:hypothetical protein
MLMYQETQNLTRKDFELRNSFRVPVRGGVSTPIMNLPLGLLMKVVFTIGCFGIFSVTSHAQVDVQLDLGVKGGLNYASVNSSAVLISNKSGIFGGHGGVYGMVKIGRVFAVQAEIVYSNEGQAYKYYVAGFPTYKSTFSYFNYPILLKFYVAEGLNLQFGPQFGYLNNSKGYTYVPSGNGGAPTISEGPLGDYVKAYNISLCVGMGWDLPMGLNFTLRYNGGLTDINKLSGQYSLLAASPFGTSSANSSVLQFSVGYRILKFGSTPEY